MERLGFPGLEAHRRMHEGFSDRIAKMYEQAAANHSNDIVVELMGFLKSWLINHILDEDARIGAFARSLAVPPGLRLASGRTLVAAVSLAIIGAGTGIFLLGSAGAAGLVVLLILGLLSALLFGGVQKLVLVPLGAVSSALDGIVIDSDEAPMPPVAGIPEVRQIGSKLAALRNALRDRGEKRQEAKQVLSWSDEQMQETFKSVAEKLEEEIRHGIKTVSDRAGALSEVAGTMKEQSAFVTQHNRTVSEAAKAASLNVANVSNATDVLLASIEGMRSNAEQSNEIAVAALSQARDGQAAVAGLADASKEIGAVVKLIAGIAGQTNLLALNATIEAARAGDAGKGFAVVATEVKHLATQTAQATQQIAQQINAVQSTVANVVGVMEAIAGTIRRISEISGDIAATTVNQQDQTAGIADQARSATGATRSVSEAVAEISQNATDAEQMSSLLQSTVGGVTNEMIAMQGHLVTILRSSFLSNRRRHPRIDVEYPCRVTVKGIDSSAQVKDISLGGALLDVVDANLDEGSVLHLTFNRIGPVECQVIAVSDGGTHVKFHPTEEQAASLNRLIEEISPEESETAGFLPALPGDQAAGGGEVDLWD